MPKILQIVLKILKIFLAGLVVIYSVISEMH